MKIYYDGSPLAAEIFDSTYVSFDQVTNRSNLSYRRFKMNGAPDHGQRIRNRKALAVLDQILAVGAAVYDANNAATAGQTGGQSGGQQTGQTAASATGCIHLIKGDYLLQVQNRCNYPVVAFVCYPKQISGAATTVCKQSDTVIAGSGYGDLFGGLLRPGEKHTAGQNVPGKIRTLACNASQKDSYGRLPHIAYSSYGAQFSCRY